MQLARLVSVLLGLLLISAPLFARSGDEHKPTIKFPPPPVVVEDDDDPPTVSPSGGLLQDCVQLKQKTYRNPFPYISPTHDADGDNWADKCDACPMDPANHADGGYLYVLGTGTEKNSCLPPGECRDPYVFHDQLSKTNDRDGDLRPNACDTCPRHPKYWDTYPYYDPGGNGYCRIQVDDEDDGDDPPVLFKPGRN